MKKKIVIGLLVLFLVSVTNLFAQGFAVIDVANLIQSIETVYQTYQNIQNTIQQVQNQYQQIKQTYEQMKSIDWSNFDSIEERFSNLEGKNPWETTGNIITATRNSAQDIINAVDNNMNKVNRFAESLTKKTISFGGMDVSVADLCGFGKPENSIQGFMTNAAGSLWGTAQNIAHWWSHNLTYAEKEALMQQYGMSPENYATMQVVNAHANDLANAIGVAAHGDSIRQELLAAEQSAAITCELINSLPEGNSYALAQLSATQLVQIEKAVHDLGTNITRAAGLYAADGVTKRVEQVQEQFQKAEEERLEKERFRHKGQGGEEKSY